MGQPRVLTQSPACCVGARVPRVDGVEMATGASKYFGDIELPGMLTGGLFRAELPHALIRFLDVEAVRHVPGIRAVLTASDLPPVRFGPFIKDKTILATNRVRYKGEPVVALAAEDGDALEEALSRIRVDYEPLPAVFDPEEALLPEVPLIHPEADSYRTVRPFPRGGEYV